jgi:hypothetical protein
LTNYLLSQRIHQFAFSIGWERLKQDFPYVMVVLGFLMPEYDFHCLASIANFLFLSNCLAQWELP